jgi:hypothetical protein
MFEKSSVRPCCNPPKVRRISREDGSCEGARHRTSSGGSHAEHRSGRDHELHVRAFR